MFGIDVETLSKLIGGTIGAALLFIVGKVGISNRKVEVANAPPMATGFVIDGDTALSIRDELRALRANQERFHDEENRRREADEKRGLEEDIVALRRQNEELKRGQTVTHSNQGELLEMIRGLMSQPGVAEERLRIHRSPVIEHRDDGGVPSPPDL